MLLFRDEEHVKAWREARGIETGYTMTPEQGWQLAHAWYQDKVKPDWRRHSLEETEEILGRIGLTGPFWNLR